MSAVNEKDVDLVKRLLANGADAQATNINGQTALMIAAENGNEKLAELLLPKSNAKANNKYGDTALMIAAYYYYGNKRVVELLLPKSDAKATDNHGLTALDYAKSYGHKQIVRLLQQYN